MTTSPPIAQSADQYGEQRFPIDPPTPGQAAGDPALNLILDFSSAVLNAMVGPAWDVVCPKRKVVERTFASDPEKDAFTDQGLPALYGFRVGGKPPISLADQWRTTFDGVLLRWVFPLQPQLIAKLRSPVITAMTKALDRAFYDTRSPAYVNPNDTDPAAPTLGEQPDLLLTSHHTATSLQTFTGSSLDGPLAGAPFSPARGVILDLGGNPSDWVDGSTIVVSGLNILGTATSQTIVIVAARIPCRMYTTNSFSEVGTIMVDAQSTTAGTLRAGLGARAGYGTSIPDFGHIDVWVLKTAVFKPVKIGLRGGPEVRAYPAIEWSLEVRERLIEAPQDFPVAGAGIDNFGQPLTGSSAGLTLLNPDGIVVVNAAYP